MAFSVRARRRRGISSIICSEHASSRASWKPGSALHLDRSPGLTLSSRAIFSRLLPEESSCKKRLCLGFQTVEPPCLEDLEFIKGNLGSLPHQVGCNDRSLDLPDRWQAGLSTSDPPKAERKSRPGLSALADVLSAFIFFSLPLWAHAPAHQFFVASGNL